MTYEFKPSFDRTFHRLDAVRQRAVRHAVDRVIDFFATGAHPKGLGVKQLRKPFWEVRATLADRPFFTFQGDRVSFVIVGNHDEIRRFLRAS